MISQYHNKRIFVFLILILLAVPLVVGFEFDNVKQYNDKEDKITIKNSLLFIPTTKIAEYTLVENTDVCLIDCYAEGTATLYEEGSLFSDIKYKTSSGTNVNLESSNIFLIIEEEYEVNANDYGEICKQTINGTDCYEGITGTHKEKRTKEIKQIYNLETLPIGNYKWRIEGKINLNDRIDWITTSFGKELTEWAWWNSNFEKRKLLTIIGGSEVLNNFTVPINITYDSDMQTNFEDIRFINGSCTGTQDLELDYEWDIRIDSVSSLAWVRLENLIVGDNEICMYYGNAIATNGEDRLNSWDTSYTGVWHFSEGSGTVINDSIGIANGTFVDSPEWNSSQLGYAVEFDGVNDRIDLGRNALIEFTDETFTVEAVLNFYALTGERRTIFGSRDANGWGFGTDTVVLNTLMMDKNGAAGTANGADVIPTNQSLYVSAVYDQVANEVSFTQDGATDTNNPIAFTNEFLATSRSIGSFENGGGDFIGQIDDLRVSNLTRSLAWQQRSSEALNFSSFSFGGEQVNDQIQVELTFPANSTSVTNSTFNFNATFTPQNFNLTNSTLNLYYNNHTLISSTTSAVTNAENFTANNGITIPISTIFWNYEACGQNISNGTECFYPDEKNFTLIRSAFTEDSNFSTLVSYETTQETFQTNITAASGITVVSSNFIYNETTYSATVGTISATKYSLTSTIDLPQITAGTLTQNHEHHFGFAYLDGATLISTNTTTGIQRVDFINQSILSYPYTVPFINFTIYDQNTLEQINATISGTFQYGLNNTNKSFTYSHTTEDFTNYTFGFTPANKTFQVEGSFDFGKGNYQLQSYNLIQTTMQNVTLGMLEVPIYLLESGNSTTFTVFVRTSSLTGVEGAVVELQRFYPGTGTYKISESITTNSEGKGLVHLIVEDVTYRFVVRVDGVVKLTSTPTKIICESTPCTITLTLPTDVDDPFDNIGNTSDFSSSLKYDKLTQVVTYTYADTSSEFTEGKLHVRRLENSGDVIVCSNNDSTAASVITCDISAQVNGTYVATALLDRVSEGGRVVGLIMINKARDIVGTIGSDGIIIAVFLFMGIVMLGLRKPIIGILLAVAGLFALRSLQILELPWLSFLALICISLILAWEMRK